MKNSLSIIGKKRIAIQTQLVFLEPNKIDATPFTTSDVIAEYANVGYRSVQKTIEAHRHRLEQFGILRFEIAVSGKAGRPKYIYQLNEEQATLLITFLKNTETVANFKTELVRQFFAMREELMKRRDYRAELKPIRRSMTDEIRDQPECKKWDYKLYTDLAYKVATGKTAAQLRKERNASQNAVAIDYMTSDEIRQVGIMENQIAVLLQLEMNYYQIKGILTKAIATKTA